MDLSTWSCIVKFVAMSYGSMECSLPYTIPKSRVRCGVRLSCNDVQKMRNKLKSDSWPSSNLTWQLPVQSHACVNIYWNILLMSSHWALAIFKFSERFSRMSQTVFKSRVQETEGGAQKDRVNSTWPLQPFLPSLVPFLMTNRKEVGASIVLVLDTQPSKHRW